MRKRSEQQSFNGGKKKGKLVSREKEAVKLP